MPTSPTRIAALYRFAPIADPAARQAELRALCEAHGVRGTIILATEGINSTLAGSPAGVEAVLAAIRAMPGFADLEHKEAQAEEIPFLRMKVRVKAEIVTMGTAGADPREAVGDYVQPEDWNALLAEPGVICIDARNDFESSIGSFAGAVRSDTESFRDFPGWVEAHAAELQAAPKIAMFCTGGIRCERATAHLLKQGYEGVHHLKGGILKYLERVPEAESTWEGGCFVFDQRVSVGHGLTPTGHVSCHACRHPLGLADRESPAYVEGVSCHHCVDKTSPEQKSAAAERHKQVQLARKRGDAHLGSAAQGQE
jgi:UPF0176 protein